MQPPRMEMCECGHSLHRHQSLLEHNRCADCLCYGFRLAGPPLGTPERALWKLYRFAEAYGADDFTLWELQLGNGSI